LTPGSNINNRRVRAATTKSEVRADCRRGKQQVSLFVTSIEVLPPAPGWCLLARSGKL
jgi:hypothetical protein